MKMNGHKKLGRPSMPAERRHETRKSVYLTDAENETLLALFLRTGHRSESAFLGELLHLGAAIKQRQIEAGEDILDSAA